MITIPGYHLVTKLGEGPQSAVYRGFRKSAPNRPLAIKVFRNSTLAERHRAHYRQKIEHLRVVKDPMLIVAEEFDIRGGVPFVVQDYFEGLSLDEWFRRQAALPLESFFRIACQLATAIDKVHEAGIIHGGIKPHNILVRPDTLEMRLTGFVTSLDVRDVSHFIYDPAFVRDTLAYTSPEQTGRIHHVVVFSSDLYSLGIVFYELLARRLPFRSTDPLALIHQHLAEEAPQVHELNAEIPVTLSRIVTKLTLKQPEKRYQSGRGLLADLERCRSEWEVGRSIGRFPLATQDRSRRVVFVSKMVGRDKEARAVLDAFEPVTRGEFRSILISGLPGIGKTRLIQELQQPIVRHRGYFTSGKFDIYQKNIPYSSIVQALRNLIRTFLTETQERIVSWQRRILEAVGQNGRVLIDVIPELEALIGPQPPVPSLPPVEARNRFHNLFDRFLGCLACAESPLTMFIDDLQWCDMASFDFLQTVLANPEDHPYLLLIGAYRHNEVDSSHPLTKLIARAKAGGSPVEEIRLERLAPVHCQEMVSYILDTQFSRTEALSAFLVDLTEGNPLFVSESLSYLYNEDLLFVDDEMQWRWDLERIRQSNMPSSVVALFSAKILKLLPASIEVLQRFACMGNTVSPEDLALVSDLSLAEMFELLKPALGSGLIIENRGNLQFIHDRVQEAVLASIPSKRRRQIHWQVGQKLLSMIPEGVDVEGVDNLFAIVSHLNLGKPSRLSAAQRRLLTDMNVRAGEKALNALATNAASEYFARSKDLLPADCWESDYEKAFQIFKKAAKTELMCGRQEQSEALLAELLQHARTDLDKAEALAEQTTSLSSIGNFNRAIETANQGLTFFGKAIPADPEEADRRRAVLTAELRSQHPDVWNEILAMPFTTDRKSKIELAFYSELIPDLYMSGLVPQLYLSAVQSTHHSLAGGMDESVIYSFSIMGLQFGEQEEFEQAFRYEDLARELSARYPNTFGATRGMNGIVWCNMHSRSHPEEIVDYCLRGIQCGKNCGDLYNAGLCYGPLMWNLQVQGADFGAIEEYARECRHFSERNNLSFSVGLAEAMEAGWIAPMKKGYVPIPMEERIERWQRDNHIAAAGSYYAHLAMSRYYFGEYEDAARALLGVKRCLAGLTDNVLKRQWYVFQVLNALKLRPPESVLDEMAPIIAKIERWAALGPLLKPYLAFLYAERERSTGSFETARGLYLDAIAAAHAQRYVFLEGHLNESLGEMMLAGKSGPARPFLLEAARLYSKCRAERKELQLYERYPEVFETGPAIAIMSAAEPEPAQGQATESYALPQLDIGYIMRSALAISAEIDHAALLRKVMVTLMESSGAQHGYLIMPEGGHLSIKAEGHAPGSDEKPRLANRRLEDEREICSAMVRYVFRTSHRLVLSDASQEGDFKDNPQVLELGLRSVLCLPIVKQGSLIGILYLENRLAPAIFTPAAIQTTEILAAHAAISIENARLVEDMKRTEEALAEEREHLAVTLHCIGDGVIATDTESRIVMLNRIAEELTGWTKAEAQGKPLTEIFRIVNERTRKPVESPVVKVLKSGQTVSLANNTVLLSRDGREISIADSAAPIYGKSGQVLGVVLVFRDVTEARLAEEALQQREQELRELTRSLEKRVHERTMELDSANRTLRMMIECNEVLVRATNEQELAEQVCRLIAGIGGFPMAAVSYATEGDHLGVVAAAQAFGGTPVNVCPGNGNDRFDCVQVADCVRTGTPRIVASLADCPEKCPIRREFLEQGLGSLLALPLSDGEKPFGALTILSHKRDALDQSQLALLQELASDMAFGIGALRTRVERDRAFQIAAQRTNQLRALATELVQTEQRERQRLARVLHDHLQQLLVAAKFSIGLLGRNESVKEACAQVTDVLDQAIQASRSLTAELSPPVLQEKGLSAGLRWLARNMKEKHGLEVNVDTTPIGTPLVQHIRAFLFESVREFLFNIVKHSGVDSARVLCKRNGDELLVRVEDEGSGFDVSRLEVAGEAGAGFGLFSIRERASYLGGRLVVESTPGAGSRFSLYMPMAVATAAVQPAAEKRRNRSSGLYPPIVRLGTARRYGSFLSTTIRCCATDWPGCCRTSRTSQSSEKPETARQEWSWPAICCRMWSLWMSACR